MEAKNNIYNLYTVSNSKPYALDHIHIAGSMRNARNNRKKKSKRFLACSNEIAGSQIDIVHIIKILITATSSLAPSIYLFICPFTPSFKLVLCFGYYTRYL